MPYQVHPDSEVQNAIIRLNDALCMWEIAKGKIGYEKRFFEWLIQ